MKGYWFYIDYGDAATKRKVRGHGGMKRGRALGTPDAGGNCIALFTEKRGQSWCPEYDHVSHGYGGLAATFFHVNSDTSVTSVGPEYLRTSCARISEAEARRVHPVLMQRIDEAADR